LEGYSKNTLKSAKKTPKPVNEQCVKKKPGQRITLTGVLIA